MKESVFLSKCKTNQEIYYRKDGGIFIELLGIYYTEGH